MTTLFFSLPRLNISLTAPEEVAATVSFFYPNNVREERPNTVAYDYLIERKKGEWALYRNSEFLSQVPSPLQSVMNLEYDIETALLLHRGDWLAVHGGCVAVGDGVCLIAGDPEAGKTTTTFHLVELGHAFMSEEITFIDSGAGTVHPFPQSLALESAFIEEASRFFPLTGGDIHPLNPYLVRYAPKNVRFSPLKMTTILVPDRGPGASAGICSLGPGDFLTEFMGYCFEPKEGLERFMDSVIGLLEKCRILRLHYRDSAECRRQLQSLF